MMKQHLRFGLLLFILISCSTKPEFDGQISYDLIQKQLDFGPRNPGSKGHREMTKWLVKELRKTSATVRFQSFKWEDKRFNKTYPMNNVMASFYPEKQTRFLLGAHFDTNPIAEKDPVDSLKMKPIPGAIDGASGVSVLLQIAKLVNVFEPSYGIDLIFFDGEDLGDFDNPENYCIGSREFAKKMKSYKPAYAVLVDLIGHKNAVYRYELNSLLRQEVWTMKVWNTAAELGYGEIFIPEKGMAVNDDHIPLLEIGIPMINIIDTDIIDDKDNIHHTHNDIIDHISPESLKIVGDVLIELLYE